MQLNDDQPGATDSLLNGEALKLYGFGDVGYRQMLVPKSSPWLVYLNRHPSMFVGHLNFYFDSQLAERWRALAEVRFTYMPQGGLAHRQRRRRAPRRQPLRRLHRFLRVITRSTV